MIFTLPAGITPKLDSAVVIEMRSENAQVIKINLALIFFFRQNTISDISNILLDNG